jgi:hypothetical protein
MHVFVFSIINCILIYAAYLYLKKLKSCECVNHDYTKKLAKTEHTLFMLTSISLILAGIELFFKPKQMYHKYFNFYWIYSYVFFLVILLVDAYFVYYTYHFQRTLQPHCKCANKWQKYYIYYQAIMYLFVLVVMLLTGYVLLRYPNEISIKDLKKSSAQSHRMLYKY